ncbi:leucine-rich repeat domain-containing protein [Pseudoteredinibacter isoporae]|uniref:Leucine-rich repeat domain-containing protein n=1 Tax=Pseudoteredinibacter isoporae TaxID=570281 RepID=A0A7X0MWZ4_9GAMM|nr:leucine-rich repeat domain-containing protein [Pseudoteredinibacter isoporae]MBB6523186.1 hypothetical protein [Pseudoteredinibacter isoporae]NHO88704.1 leucine-rich repeat domain-containing protein [Pseudoteredinibacter isoporae]NIB22605.1 leucine-rich repeat domain-containing protein [Pseudoteredinibacter isoporae]
MPLIASLFRFSFVILALIGKAHAQTFNFGPADTVTGCTGCSSTITIPQDNAGTTVTSVGPSAFFNNSLTSVTFPSSITTIQNSAFAANAFATITLPDGLTTIEDLAFNSNSLTTVTIPASVTNIGDSAFEDNDITTVLFEGDRPAFGGNRVFASNAPVNTINYCAGASGWPGADIEGITPTVVTCPSATAASPNAVPTSTPFTIAALAGLFLTFASRARNEKSNRTY